MNFKKTVSIWLVIASAFLSSCFGKQKSTKNTADDFGFFKTEGAKEACVQSNVSQWELSGKFLHNFLGCASNKSVDGEEKLSGLQNLLAELDEQELQKVLDFVLTVDPNGATHEERYPYLLAATTLLDRGIIDGRALGLNLTTERLGPLQDFLVTLDATRSKDIISTWSRSGHLAEVLNEFGIFVDQLQDNTLESATHELLAGSTLKPEFISLSRRFFKEDLLFTNLSDALQKRRAIALNTREQSVLLNPFRESTTASDKTALPTLAIESVEETTPLKEFADQHAQYSPEELNSLTAVVTSFWQSYQKLGEAERVSLDSRLADGMNSVLGQQASSVKWLLALFHDVNLLKAKDLDRVTYAVDQLLLEGSNISLEAIRAKAGATKLMFQLQTLLTQGGSVANCPVFAKPALSGNASFQELTAALNTLSSPNAECGGRIPLIAAIESITGVAIADTCGNQTACLTTVRPLANTESLWNTSEPESALTRRLTLESLSRLKDLTAKDPYILFDLGLAKDRVSVDTIAALQKRLEAHSDWSLNGLAQLDLSMAEDLSSPLQSDFIEKLLTYRIEKLASQSSQFADLAPERSEEIDATVEMRSSRIFSGLYSDGPLEQLLAKKISLEALPFTADQQDLKAYLEAHPSIVSRLLFKAKESDGIFRSPITGTLVGEANTNFSDAGSSLRNYLGFENGAALSPVINATTSQRIVQPFQTTRTFSDDDQGRFAWSMWYQHFGNGPLTTKDVPAELSGKLMEWYFTSLVPTLSSDAFWPELQASSQTASLGDSLNRDYFDVVDYSPAEARMLSIYYLKAYQKPTPLLPAAPEVAYGKSSAPKSDLSAIPDPIRGFMNVSYLVKDDYEAQYTAFAKYFPEVLGRESQISALKNSILPDYATFMSQITGWSFAEQAQVNDVTRLAGDTTSPFALLSSLDLLTFSKPQTRFIPQSLVGFGGKLCRSKIKDTVNATVWNETPTACPLDFQGATEEEAYNKFREYISTAAVQTLCPLLGSDNLGPRMIWSQRLGLTLDSQALCQTPRPSLMEAYRFPTWHSSRVLNDIFTMGKSAKLKAGLVQAPAGIRYYKLKQKGVAPERLASEWIATSKGVWSERNAADQRRREFFAGGFWAGSPTLLNSYLNNLSTHLDAYSWRTILIAYAERDEQGQAKDTLRDILRLFSSEQKAAALAGDSALSLGLTLFDKIGENKEYRQFLANFLTKLNTTEAYDFYANELPLATVQLFPSDVNPFEWTDKGLGLTKYFAQHSTLKSWQVLGEIFDPSEWDRFLEQLQISLRSIADVKARASILSRLSGELVHLATLSLPDESSYLTERFETLATTWSKVSLGSDFKAQWARFVTNLGLSIQGFQGQDTVSGEAMVESFLASLIQRGPSLTHAIQEAGTFADTLFWKNWADSFLASIEGESDGSLAMARFMSEQRFDLSEGTLWTALLHPGEVQNKAIGAIAAIDSVSEDIWRAALLEGANLSARLNKALAFLQSHITWVVDPEHNAYRIALDQLYELSEDEDLRDKQLELVTLWLPGETLRAEQSEIKK